MNQKLSRFLNPRCRSQCWNLGRTCVTWVLVELDPGKPEMFNVSERHAYIKYVADPGDFVLSLLPLPEEENMVSG